MRRTKKSLALALAVLLLFGLMSGCGDDTINSAAESSVASSEAASSSEALTSESTAPDDTDVSEGSADELNLRAKSFGNNYDVQDMGWRWMMAACYEGLYRNVADENGDRFELAGAESVDVSDDGLTYTFHLRQDAKWSDGVAVTAKDYEYGWKRLIDPANAYDYASFIFNVAGAKA